MNRILRTLIAATLALSLVVACDSARVTDPNLRPTADAGGGGTFYDHDGRGVAMVSLDGSASLDPDGTIASYIWTEEGARIAAESTAEVTLPIGRHVIVLTVTDEKGASDSDVAIVNVRYLPVPNTAPVAMILSPTPDAVYHDDEIIMFVGAAEDAEGRALHGESLSWELRGTSPGPLGSVAILRTLGTGDSVRASGVSSGEYAVTLTATDAGGARGRASATFTVRFHVTFAADVLPFFVDYCVECHGADRAEGGIRLDGYEAIVTGGSASSPLIVPGDPTQGILIPQVLSDHEPVGWGGNEVSSFLGTVVLPAWIEEGAPDN